MTTIVIVDDEIDIAEVLASVLEDEGYTVVSASNGSDGHRVIAKERPDLVLMDVMMPGLSGIDVLRAMREDPALERIPVILMSAVDPYVSQKDANFQAFIRKPFTLQVLLDNVRRQVGS